MNTLRMIYDLLKEVREEISEIKEQQIKDSIQTENNTKCLEDHMKRTLLLEELVCTQRDEIDKKIADLDRYVKRPLISFKKVKYISMWVVGLLTGIVGIVVSIKKLFL